MTKNEMRVELSTAMEEYIASGRKVTVIAAVNRKQKSICRAKTKVTFGTKAPGRVVSSWVGVEASA